VLHRDILISSIAGTLAAAITALSRMAFWFGGAGMTVRATARGAGNADSGAIAAMMIQMAISRSGNSMPMRRRRSMSDRASADWGAAEAGCLFEAHSDGGQSGDSAPLHHETAGGGSMMRLFSTHPALRTGSRARNREVLGRRAALQLFT